MAVNVKIGADIGGFKSQIQQGQSILKGLNAEMKATEAEFKATGNAEKALEQKTKTLNSQLQVQKGIADQAAQALKSMEEAGIKPTDAAYQKMYATMMNATAGMNQAQAALNGLSGSAEQAATNADALSTSVNSISKKISLDQVISGINSITSALEGAAKKAIQLGEDIWNAMMQSAQLADDIGTQATMMDMTPERYQQYKGVFDTIGEITVSEWAATKRKVQKAINNPTQDQVDVLKALGLTVSELQDTGGGILEFVRKDWETLFWEAGSAIKQKVESGQMSLDLADTYGEMLFGKKYSSLKSLIGLGQEGFAAALEEQTVASDEAIKKDAELNDAVIKLQNSFEALKMEVLSGLAPALTDAVGTIDSLLGKIMDYLQTPEGQEALQNLQEAVSGLFDDLGKIDPKSVVENFTNVFNGLISGLQWIVDNKDSLIGALTAVVAGWGALKIGGGLLQIMKLIDGLRDLGVIGGGAAASGAAGAVAGGGLKAAIGAALGNVAKTAPFLAPLLLGADALISGWNLQDEAAVKGEQSYAAYQAEAAQNAGSRYQEVWDTLMRYTTPTGSPEDHAGLENFAKRWVSWWSDDTQDTILNELTNAMTDEQFLQINDMMNRIVAGELFNGEADRDALLESVESMIGTLNELMANEKIDAQLDVTTTSDDIAKQVGTITLPASVYVSTFLGSLGSIFGFHANGLPFVPYDGYLAMLHRGERVLTASANRNYTFNSNNYFGNVNLNNGQDIDALCTSIDRHNRQVQSGFGA